MSKVKKYARHALWLCLGLCTCVVLKTGYDLHTPTLSLRDLTTDGERFQVLDRYGEPLAVSYQNRFNTLDSRPLHKMPAFLRDAFITSEDRRFFSHHGVDWNARLSALWQNLRAGKTVRGASTITEQVVRIIHPRPRNLWSRWLEGWEAMLLEYRASKGEILEFYLNQVPYASNRRGVAQAARHYFNRDLSTLTPKEMMALAVLPRAPSALDLYRNPDAIEPAIARLASVMGQDASQPLVVEPGEPMTGARHFVDYIRDTTAYQLSEQGVLTTTLDATLQRKAQTLLNERVKALRSKKVHNGAVLIADHTTGEILAWAVADIDPSSSAIDAVRTPRQPGSSMKPFLYALALDSGWSPATELTDAPMSESIGFGLHDFHNYSRTFYGKISLREALGNSLNIPALQTIGFVGAARYLDTLHALKFDSLIHDANYYREGLALGSGEVTLFEMVQAYNALANHGVFKPLIPVIHDAQPYEKRRVYSEEAASLIGHILSDPYARRQEFGGGSVLNLPIQTAVKTGTSTDYRDAWVIGFNARYTIGIWLGNLDRTSMDGVTGSTGPALILRSLFSELNAHDTPGSLYLSPKLVQKNICSNHEQPEDSATCFSRTEYFIAGTEENRQPDVDPQTSIVIIRPTEGLHIAYDPRVPAEHQAFELKASTVAPHHKVEWVLNGQSLGVTSDHRMLWPITRGKYTLLAKELDEQNTVLSTHIRHFIVK